MEQQHLKSTKIDFNIFGIAKKLETIARKTIFFKKKLGDLNLIEPKAHNYAMRIKHSLTLKQNLNPSPWENLATYC